MSRGCPSDRGTRVFYKVDALVGVGVISDNVSETDDGIYSKSIFLSKKAVSASRFEWISDMMA